MEKNRHILEDALQRLQTFSPNESVWEEMQSNLSDSQLKSGLVELKTLNPPEQVWDSISDELAKQEKVKQFKEFTPNDEIWESIDDSLGKAENAGSKIRFFTLSGWAAAAVILMLMSYFLLIQNKPTDNITYSEETIEIVNIATWQDDDMEVLGVLRELCTSNPMACSTPTFKEKEKELFYLNEQKSEIIRKLNAYDENKKLEVLLTKIELEKNEIVKQMISEIL